MALILKHDPLERKDTVPGVKGQRGDLSQRGGAQGTPLPSHPDGVAGEVIL